MDVWRDDQFDMNFFIENIGLEKKVKNYYYFTRISNSPQVPELYSIKFWQLA